MSKTVLNTINSEQSQRDLLEQASLGNAEAGFQWVLQSEQQGQAQSDEDAQKRVDLLVQASNQNYAAASTLLGQWHLLGHYVPQDVQSAILFFQHAAKLNDALAHLELFYIARKGVVETLSSQQGLIHLQQAVQLNHPEAIHIYAEALLNQDAKKSQQLLLDNYLNHQYQSSLKLFVQYEGFNQDEVQRQLENLATNDSFACALLAFHYLKNNELEKAFKYAHIAQEQNDAYGCYIRALLEQKSKDGSSEIAQAFFLKAANNGHVESAYIVAVELLKQSDITTNEAEKNALRQQAFTLMQQAALAGNKDAQYSFAQCLRHGLGTEKDAQHGLQWLERAAQNHHRDAQFELSMLLPIEHEQHIPLLMEAAKNGHIQAMLCMAIYEQRLNNTEDTLKWLHQAKDAHSARAHFLLAQIYRDGTGVEADAKESVEFLKQAADLGDIDAYFELFKAYKDGLGVRKNKKTAGKYLDLAKQSQHIEAASIEY